MLLAAVDFQLLTGAQVHEAVAALGFEDEIELFLSVLGQIDGPVRVIRSDGSVDLEPIRDLKEHLDVGVVIQGNGKGALNGAAVIDDVIIDTVLHLHRIPVQICNQLRRVKDLLHIVFSSVQLDVADPVDCQRMAMVADQLNCFFQEGFRVIQEIPASAALYQDLIDRCRCKQGFIPATLSRFTAAPINSTKKRRVAAYARVSTDNEEQLTSYEAQVDYYTNYIQGRDDWEFAGVYTDEGITGTNTKKREGFKSMVADALAGKIDLIITKSVSRFARNTVDSLTTIRSLKEHNVECYFEKENIWTFDGKGELLLTIMSSLAQEESRSISENCTWGQRKRFADGKVTVPFNRFLGYDMGPDHNLVVNPEQAKLVKRIYGMFLQGQSPFQIARTLTEEGIPSPGGKDHWNPSNIKSILTNEKYKGDALLQKTFTVDFLTKKKKANEGEIPQYYVKDNHEAIIDPETFEMVQTLMATRKKGRNRKSSVSIFSSKVKCGDCGSWYGPKVWHSNDAYRKVIWQCNHKFDGQKCATPTLTEDEIKELFLRAANQVIDQKEQFIAIYEQVLSRSLDTTVLDSELSDLEAEINIAAELIEECIKENAHVALDQAEYQKRYDALVARFDKAKARHTEVTDLIAERTARRHQIETYLKELRSREPLTEFRETDWLAMVDYITVHSKNDIRVTFKDGTEIKA